MKEIATVVKTAGKIAVVQIEKHPECEGCKICAFKDGKSRVKVKALNSAKARAGERVIVQAEKDNRLLASFIVYIIPVLLGGIGVLIGALCFEREFWAPVLFFAGLALGFGAVFACDRLFSKTRGFGMEVVEILHTDEKETSLERDAALFSDNQKLSEEENKYGRKI